MHTIVVGAGIVGLSIGYELGKDGHGVTVVDAGRPGHGSTIGNAAKIALAETTPVPAPGMVRQGIRWMLNPNSPLYVRPSLAPDHVRFLLAMARHCTWADFRRGLGVHLDLVSTCLAVLDEWRSEGIDFEEHRRGVLLAYEHADSFRERRSYDDVFEQFDHVGEPLDAEALHDREPALSDRIRHGLYYARDRQLEPRSIVTGLTKALVEMGHQVLSNVAVTGFARRGDHVAEVLSADQALRCDTVVLAAGAHCGPLTRLLGSPLPIRPGKGYTLHYPDPPTAAATPITLEDARVAVSPLDGGLRIGGTMEFGGFDRTIRLRRVEAIRRACAAAFRDWDPSPAHDRPWAGLRPMTPDGLPIVGRVPGYGNVVVASGHGMLGLTLAPSTAKTVARTLRGERLSSSEQALDPRRF